MCGTIDNSDKLNTVRLGKSLGARDHSRRCTTINNNKIVIRDAGKDRHVVGAPGTSEGESPFPHNGDLELRKGYRRWSSHLQVATVQRI
jgi:hypothetical protein